jgi:protein-S-isoprenylcysteine O-methyltransferase Ste14
MVTPSAVSPSLGATTPPPARTGLDVWLRRYRRYLPVPLVLVTLGCLRPVAPGGSMILDTLADGMGIGLCLLGQWMRVWAWGSNATVGKWGVRDRGPYAMMRHPLYVGNFLILLGLVVVFHNPWAYPLWLLPFAYLYHVITAMEEKRMHRRFGVDYHNYTHKEVPRFLPALDNLGVALRTTRPFGWRFASWKEYESCCGWLAGVAILQIYEGVVWRGWTQNWPYTQRWLIGLGIIGIVSLWLRIRKSLVQPFNQ